VYRTVPHCVVVGGGIAGLAAAYQIRQRRPDVRVTVLEAAQTIGGKLAQAEVGGTVVDTGAEAVLNRRPEAVDLIRAVGLADDVCHPAATTAYVWSRGRMRPLPPTVLGVPTDLRALARSGVVSAPGVGRAALDRVLPARPPGEDVPVGRLVRRRLGHEVSERLLEPLLGGVYAGHADRLSLHAATPQVAALAARGGSLIGAAASTAVGKPVSVKPSHCALNIAWITPSSPPAATECASVTFATVAVMYSPAATSPPPNAVAASRAWPTSRSAVASAPRNHRKRTNPIPVR